jgi:hypothetical protein
MLAMQYSIQLPRGYDPALIRQRVEKRRTLFDNLPGMLHKAFLYSDFDKLYAPFYVWENLPEAKNFLLDELFQGVIETFKRPRVRSWVIMDQQQGLFQDKPSFAIREVDLIPAEEDLEHVMLRERKLQKELLEDPSLYYHLTAIDPDRWEIIRYHLWKDQKSAVHAAADCVQTYDVLHVSEPRTVSKVA